VGERGIDGAVDAALPYFGPEPPPVLKNRVAWLFGTALRAAKRATVRELPSASVDPDDLVPIPAKQDREPNNLVDLVTAALGKLTEKQRLAVTYCVMLGWSLQEVAEEMKCARRTIIDHRNAGLRRLREILTKTFVHQAHAPTTR